MLEKVTHIEGFEGIQDVDMLDDTKPFGVRVEFSVQSEEMPFKTAEAGRVIRENFVHVKYTMELGRSVIMRRVRDKVRFDEKTGKWKIEMLAAGDNSDIRKHPAEWNAFFRGTTIEASGTPLTLLFKNDPARCEMYEHWNITTIDQLAATNYTDAVSMGMGGVDDVKRAQAYLEKVSKLASGTHTQALIEQRDAEISSLRAQLADYGEKLTELLEADARRREEQGEGVAPKRKAGRPAKQKVEPAPEGIEGI